MQRRDFLIQTGLASLLPAAGQAAGGRGDIKITDIKTYLVGVGARDLFFVKVESHTCPRKESGAGSLRAALPAV